MQAYLVRRVFAAIPTIIVTALAVFMLVHLTPGDPASVMLGSDAIKKLIQEHARVSQLFAAALEEGMLTLKMDGIEKHLSGLTDMKQVRAVCIK